MAKKDLKQLLAITNNSPFRTPALGERLAAMLNHNMAQLLGSNSDNLKVNNPDEYEWHPSEFLNRIVSIYLAVSVPTFFKHMIRK
uniref:Ufd2P_core domain-containing protein n=1 Tax=Caenorhabditis tropicalis TaxID=1561998 RepID=A0A1I7TPG2_9PELO